MIPRHPRKLNDKPEASSAPHGPRADTSLRGESSSLHVDASPPSETSGSMAMADRVAARMFGGHARQRIGRYVVERKLGMGGMGVVYAATDPQLGRTVAIKLVRGAVVDASRRRRLHDEARALARLSHPNIVQVHEVGEHEGQTFLVMEHVPGTTLATWARSRPPTEVLDRLLEVGEGLATAHATGLVHRDVKPSNILVGADGRARLADFGLALPVTPTEASTAPTEQTTPLNTAPLNTAPRVVGTRAYMAPEVVAGQAATARSDQFGYCVSVWEALAGVRPFELEQLDQMARGGATPVPHGTVPLRRTRRIVMRGLHPDPNQRWPTMRELLDALRPRPWHRSTWVAGIAVSGLAVWANLAPSAAASPCPDAAQEFDATWGDEKRADHERRLVSAPPSVQASAAATREGLDRYRLRWIDARARACSATRVDKTRSAEQLDLSNACLERRRAQVATAVATIEKSTDNGLVDPRRMLPELGDPAQCLDVVALRRAPRPSAADADQVARLRERIDATRLRMAVDDADAEHLAEQLIAEARALGFTPVVAEALELHGVIASRGRRPTLAIDRLREAASLARSTDDVALEFRCLRRLVSIAADQTEDLGRAEDFVALAEGSLERLGAPVELATELTRARADVAHLRGDLPESERLRRRAVHDLEGRLSADDPRVERARVDLANALADLGRRDEAETLYETVLAGLRRHRGPQHPDVATLHFDIGHLALEHGELASARGHLQRAREIREAVYGKDSVTLASPLTLLATIAAAEDDLDAVLALTEHAWDVQRTNLPRAHSERTEPLKVRAWALVSAARFEDALHVYETLMSELPLDVAPEQRLQIRQTIGWLLCRTERCGAARPHFEAALAGGDEATALYGNIGLANVELVEGHAERALVRLEELLPKVETYARAHDEPEALAEAQWLLARALLTRGTNDDRPRALVAQARATYRSLGSRSDIVDDLERLHVELASP